MVCEVELHVDDTARETIEQFVLFEELLLILLPEVEDEAKLETVTEGTTVVALHWPQVALAQVDNMEMSIAAVAEV